ncbi:MAG TPA: aldehyde dehydrogenase family protein, partial [Turneriella sp.]|nr:aldehyde dehydrogenase family protein [Turneriella sp.]
MEIEIINPANGKSLGKVPADDHASIARKYEAARTAQPAWQNLGLAKRLEIIRRFRDRVEKDIEEAALLLTRDM